MGRITLDEDSFALAGVGLFVVTGFGWLGLDPSDPSPWKEVPRAVLAIQWVLGVGVLAGVAALRIARASPESRGAAGPFLVALVAWILANGARPVALLAGVDAEPLAEAARLVFTVAATAGVIFLAIRARRLVEGVDLALLLAFPLAVLLLVQGLAPTGPVTEQILALLHPTGAAFRVGLGVLLLVFAPLGPDRPLVAGAVAAFAVLGLADGARSLLGADFAGSWIQLAEVGGIAAFAWTLRRESPGKPPAPRSLPT